MKLKICDENLKVSRIFHSIQGEGPTTGVPAIFIRLALCNLACFFCDSGYTWKWNNRKKLEGEKFDPEIEIKEMTPTEIMNEIKKTPSYENFRTVVLTGGEPLLQQKSKSFYELISMLHADGLRIEIETNGTIRPYPETDFIVDQYNVSPKMSNSGNRNDVALKEPLSFFVEHWQKSYFKFIVNKALDYETKSITKELAEIFALLKEINPNRLPLDHILLMPQCTTKQEHEDKSKNIIEACKLFGFRFSPRMHILLIGTGRDD